MVRRYSWDCGQMGYLDENGIETDWSPVVMADDYDALVARLAEAVAALHEIAHAHDADARRLRLIAADALIRHNAADSADVSQNSGPATGSNVVPATDARGLDTSSTAPAAPPVTQGPGGLFSRPSGWGKAAPEASASLTQEPKA